VTRLEAARAGLERLEEDTHHGPSADAVRAALNRMAQLEKVAELARDVHDRLGRTTNPAYMLGLALTELDNHPDTREPRTITTTEKDR
jgi:hypothetical protein